MASTKIDYSSNQLLKLAHGKDSDSRIFGYSLTLSSSGFTPTLRGGLVSLPSSLASKEITGLMTSTPSHTTGKKQSSMCFSEFEIASLLAYSFNLH